MKNLMVDHFQGDEFEPVFDVRLEFETAPAPVPEPTTLLLLGTGVAMLAARRHRMQMRGTSEIRTARR